ncbi:MAG: M14 family metallopeptidase [Candidatus Methanomethylicia archaeon]
MGLKGIPSPEEFLGFKVGEDRKLANWNQILEYFKIVGERSDRVIVEFLGKTTEGNDMILAIISSSENLKKLDYYRSIQEKLHNPEGLSENEISKLIDEGKTIVLVTCSIHSTEIAASQMSIELLYKLAIEDSDEFKEILDNVILLLIPSLNPDGHVMVVNWYNKTLGTKYEGSAPPWLYHKYAGHDNNRDWFMLNLIETRLVVEKVHNRWHPQIVYDLHQMGPYGPRLWLPPYLDPIDPNVDPILQQEIVFMGSSMANELIGRGFKGVACYAIYDAWTPARAYQHYHGGIRILSEAASVKIATPIEIKPQDLRPVIGLDPSKQRWNNPYPWRGGIWRLRDIIDYELAAVIACLRNAAKYRRFWIANTIEIFKRALKPEGGPFAFIIPPNQKDLYNLYWLLDILHRGLVKINVAEESFIADGIEFPKGSFIIYFAQPYGRYAKTLLEVQVYPDLRESPEQPPKRPYDLTAWTLPLMMNVKVYTVNGKFNVKSVELKEIKYPDGIIIGDRNAKYLLASPESNASYKLAINLLLNNFKVYRIPNEISISDVKLPPGVFVFENDDKLKEKLPSFLKGLPVVLYACDNLTNVNMISLKIPRIGLYRNWIPNADEGWARFLFEMFNIPYMSIGNNEIRNGNLNSRFDVIIIAGQNLNNIVNGRSVEEVPPEYAGGIGDVGVENLNEFVLNGGKLITIDESCELPIKRMWIPVVNVLENLKPTEFYIPGSILRVIVNNKHPIGFGMDIDSAIMFINSPAFKCPEEYVVAKYPSTNPLLSGWILGEKYLYDAAAVACIPKGYGKIVLFGFPVYSRCQTPATFKFLFNAILH